MKIVLSVTIAIKDYFPKDQNIPYDKFICIFNNNNLNSKIKLSNISTQNSFKHKVECLNSNIVYNLHMLDSTKNSLIGIYQLIINFDKIKNLNVNDILTQEETAKLIIDSKTKRKLFDKITNLGDIYLILSSEIKILGKKPHISDGRENKISSKRSSNIDSNNLFLDFNLSPRNIKKKQIIKILKNERDALKELDEYSIFNENNNNMTDFIMDENDISLLPNDTLRKYKSLNNKKMTSQNSIKYNELNSKNQYFENSSTQMISPKFSSTNYNFKKEDSKKTFLKKKQLSKKKVTILNLMEQKMDPALYSSCTTKDRNTLELSTLLNGFKNTNVNFNKIQVNHLKKNSFTSLNTHSSFKCRRKQKQTFSDKNNSNFIDEINNNNNNNVNNNSKIYYKNNSQDNNIQIRFNDKSQINEIPLNINYKTDKAYIECNELINKNLNLTNNIDLGKLFLELEESDKPFNNADYLNKEFFISGLYSGNVEKVRTSLSQENNESNENEEEKLERYIFLSIGMSKIAIIKLHKDDFFYIDTKSNANKDKLLNCSDVIFSEMIYFDNDNNQPKITGQKKMENSIPLLNLKTNNFTSIYYGNHNKTKEQINLYIKARDNNKKLVEMLSETIG